MYHMTFTRRSLHHIVDTRLDMTADTAESNKTSLVSLSDTVGALTSFKLNAKKNQTGGLM